MYKMNLIQDGRLFYQLLNKASWKGTMVMISWVTLLNTIQSFFFPQVESFDVMDDSDAICIRGNYERIWVENKSYM